MKNIQPLCPRLHGGIKIEASASGDVSSNRRIVSVIVTELLGLSLDIPLFITKHPKTGAFDLSAIMAIEDGENLFLRDGEWCASQVPLNILREPFHILRSDAFVGESQEVIALAEGMVVGIDLESPRTSDEAGLQLFDEGGSPSPYLRQITTMLASLYSGHHATRLFLQTLAEMQLIAPAQIELPIHQKGFVAVNGLYTVDLARLADLDEAAIVRFHLNGYLQAIHAISNSAGHLAKLARWHQERQVRGTVGL